MKSIYINFILFLILIISPLIIFSLQINSLNDIEKQKRFLTAKIKLNIEGVNFESPKIEEVLFPENYLDLSTSEEVEVGDYIFKYKNSGKAIFIDRDTESIIGIFNYGQ